VSTILYKYHVPSIFFSATLNSEEDDVVKLRDEDDELESFLHEKRLANISKDKKVFFITSSVWVKVNKENRFMNQSQNINFLKF